MISRPTILVADSDKRFRRMLKAQLRSRGYRVMEARDGEEALDKARRQRPDLLVAAVLMPKVDGYTLDLELQDDSATAGIPVVFVTEHKELRHLFQETKEARVAAWYDKTRLNLARFLSKVRQLTRWRDERWRISTEPEAEACPKNSPEEWERR